MSGSWYDDFLQLRAAVVRSVAMAWARDHQQPDDVRQTFRGEFVANPLKAMYEWFGYICPFDMGQNPADPTNFANQTGLRVDDSPSGGTSDHPGPPDLFAPAYTGGWVGLDNTINLYLPPAPPNKAEWAEALAAFNQHRTLFLSYPYSDPMAITSSTGTRTDPKSK